jgi:hypothetical protein
LTFDAQNTLKETVAELSAEAEIQSFITTKIDFLRNTNATGGGYSGRSGLDSLQPTSP